MKRPLLLLTVSLILLLVFSCRKDKKSNPEPEPEITRTDIQVVLPAGSPLDLTKTKVFTLSLPSDVGSDGKSSVPFNAGSYDLALLLDETDNALLAGFISDQNKEISIASTAQVLLYFGLGLQYAGSDTIGIEGLKKIPSYSEFGNFKNQLEQLFLADHLMFSKRQYKDAYVASIAKIKKVDVLNVFGKQVKVEDADEAKSGIIIQTIKGNDESVQILNHRLRRAHAFLYKTGFKEPNQNFVTLINTIYNSTAHNDELPVKSGSLNRQNLVSPEVTGPVPIPLQSNELEALWKVRIVGPGKASGVTFTNAEASKLEELWVEFFAVDIVMPNVLIAFGHTDVQYYVRSNRTEMAGPFIAEVKKHLTANIMNMVKAGDFVEAFTSYMDYVEADYYKRYPLYKAARDVAWNVYKATGKTKYVQGDQEFEAEADRHGKLIAKVTDLNEDAEIHLDQELDRIAYECQDLEEWTVKAKDDDVNITPKNSQVMRFTNHPLTVSANPELTSGQSLEFDWTTAGTYGVFKSGSTESTSVTTTAKNVTYYGKEAPGDDNIERVIVTAYIKNSNGSRELYGKDTATINVKKVKILMKPNEPTLVPIRGLKSVKMYLVNADGTNPITNSSSLQHKVEWSISGAYGHLEGNTTQVTKPNNSVTYTATDEEVKEGMENITAKVYFKLNSTGWLLQEEVKGKIKIDNDIRKVILYASSQGMHKDANSWCYVGCLINVPVIPNAISYTVTNAEDNSSVASWTVTGSEPRLHGYAPGYNDNDAGSGYLVAAGGFTWGGPLAPGAPQTKHFPRPTCGGTYKITVIVPQ